MTINQLSIFLENKKGTLLQVLQILKEAKVQIIASAIADTVDYGILRIICNNPKSAYQVLKDNGIAVALTDVFAIALDNKVGEAAEVTSIFAKADISITYLYSFLMNGKGILIFRTDNAEEAARVIAANRLTSFDESELEAL